MEDKTKLIREIEKAVDNQLIDTILFYMKEYNDIADYYFIADIFCHKCDYLAVKIAKNAKVKFVEYLTKFVNNLLTVQRL